MDDALVGKSLAASNGLGGIPTPENDFHPLHSCGQTRVRGRGCGNKLESMRLADRPVLTAEEHRARRFRLEMLRETCKETES